jgi:DNA-binding beta-propeller fold protein YncE/mono/diheme cytochrome c family protein
MSAIERPPPAIAPAPAALRLSPASGDGTGSSLVLARLGDRRIALVADADAQAVRWLDTRTDEEMPELDLGGEPSQIVVAGDGRAFVSLRDRAEVDVLDVAPGDGPALRVTARIATAEEPTGLALTPDGRTLLVACGWGHALDAFSTRTLEHAFRANLAREPRAVVTSADGRAAYVSHATASVVSVVDLVSPDHDVRAQRMEQPDLEGTQAKLAWRQGFALARAEMGILAPGVEVNTGDTTVRTETYGGIESESLPAVQFRVALVDPPHADADADADGPAPVRSPIDPPEAMETAVSGCLLPRAAAYDPMGDWLLVACAGQDTVERFDARPGKGERTLASWRVGGEPSGLALDVAGRTAVVWAQASHSVTFVPIDGYHPSSEQPDETGALRTVGLGPRVVAADAVARGRDLFHKTGDPRISSDGRSCSSCHPDGRDDGLVWATPDGPRQTPTLAGRLAGTAPYGWNGTRSTVKKHVTGTLHRLGGTGLPDDAMDALVAYCMAMKPPPRAALPGPALVEQGRDIFESKSAGCASCHMSDGTFTDGNPHDVRSKAKGDARPKFDTPSLRFVSGTAPYFHDGRYPTLRALLLGTDGKMGHTRQLSDQELTALEAYLRTL